MNTSLGIIDMGSNSVRLIILQEEKSGSYRLTGEYKQAIRLGESFVQGKYLREDKMQSAVETMGRFKQLCEVHGVNQIIAVATAAVRKAENGMDLVIRIKEACGIDIRVIPGEEEASLVHLAVSHSIVHNDALILDIGGGSFELILMKDRQLCHCISIPLGSLDFAKRFSLRDPLSKEEEKQLFRFIAQKLGCIPWLKEAKGLPLVGVGGTLRNIGKIDMIQRNYPLDLLHQYDVQASRLSEMYDTLKSLSYNARRRYPGLSYDRADIFVGPLALVQYLMKKLDFPVLTISGKGVREGLFYRYLQQQNGADQIAVSPLRLSLENILHTMNLSESQAFHVRHLTFQLFEDLENIHNIKEDVYDILETASLLWESGKIINYYNHHRNTFFVILNAQVNVLTHRQLVMSAFVASLTGKKRSSESFEDYRLLLSSKDIEICRKLSLLLHLAENLDRSSMSLVKNLSCKVDDDNVTVTLESSTYPELEIYEASSIADRFKKTFGKTLTFSVKGEAHGPSSKE